MSSNTIPSHSTRKPQLGGQFNLIYVYTTALSDWRHFSTVSTQHSLLHAFFTLWIWFCVAFGCFCFLSFHLIPLSVGRRILASLNSVEICFPFPYASTRKTYNSAGEIFTSRSSLLCTISSFTSLNQGWKWLYIIWIWIEARQCFCRNHFVWSIHESIYSADWHSTTNDDDITTNIHRYIW